MLRFDALPSRHAAQPGCEALQPCLLARPACRTLCRPTCSPHACRGALPPTGQPQVNYTLMVTAMGFLQVLLLVRQMESVTTQALAARVSLLTLAHQVGAAASQPRRVPGWARMSAQQAVPLPASTSAVSSTPRVVACCCFALLLRLPPPLCFPPPPAAGHSGCLPVPGAPHTGRGGGQPAAQLWHHCADGVW